MPGAPVDPPRNAAAGVSCPNPTARDCDWFDIVRGVDGEPELSFPVVGPAGGIGVEPIAEAEPSAAVVDVCRHPPQAPVVDWDALRIHQTNDEKGNLEAVDEDQGLRAEDERAEKAIQSAAIGGNVDANRGEGKCPAVEDTTGATSPVDDSIPGERVIVHDPDNPDMALGTVYPNMKEFRLAMRQFAINKKFELDIVKTDPSRYIGNCKVEGCPWHIVGRRQPDQKTVRVTVLVDEHKCTSNSSRKTTKPTAAWVASKAIHILKENTDMGTKDLQTRLQDDHKCTIHYDTVWKGRQKAMQELYGSCLEGGGGKSGGNETEKGKIQMIRGKRKCKGCGELGHGETSYKCHLNATKKRKRKPRKNTTKYGTSARIPSPKRPSGETIIQQPCSFAVGTRCGRPMPEAPVEPPQYAAGLSYPNPTVRDSDLFDLVTGLDGEPALSTAVDPTGGVGVKPTAVDEPIVQPAGGVVVDVCPHPPQAPAGDCDTLLVHQTNDEKGRLEIVDEDQQLRAEDESTEKARQSAANGGNEDGNHGKGKAPAVPVDDSITGERVIVHDPDNPNMALGTVYPNMKEFRLAMRQFAINKKFELDIVKTDPSRYIGNCKVEGCPWHIVGRRQPDRKTIMVTVLVDEHKCTSSGTRKTTKPSAAWVASKAIHILKENKCMGTKDLQTRLQDDYKCTIHYGTVWKGRQKVMQDLYGSCLEGGDGKSDGNETEKGKIQMIRGKRKCKGCGELGHSETSYKCHLNATKKRKRKPRKNTTIGTNARIPSPKRPSGETTIQQENSKGLTFGLFGLILQPCGFAIGTCRQCPMPEARIPRIEPPRDAADLSYPNPTANCCNWFDLVTGLDGEPALSIAAVDPAGGVSVGVEPTAVDEPIVQSAGGGGVDVCPHAPQASAAHCDTLLIHQTNVGKGRLEIVDEDQALRAEDKRTEKARQSAAGGNVDANHGKGKAPDVEDTTGAAIPVDDSITGERVIVHDPDNPNMALGTVYPNMKEFRLAMRQFAINKKFEVDLVATDPSRYIGNCKVEGCPWHIVGRRQPDRKTVMVTVLVDKHKCTSSSTRKTTKPSAAWVASKAIHILKENKCMGTKDLQTRLQDDYKCPIHYGTVWKGRQKAMQELYGSCLEGGGGQSGGNETEKGMIQMIRGKRKCKGCGELGHSETSYKCHLSATKKSLQEEEAKEEYYQVWGKCLYSQPKEALVVKQLSSRKSTEVVKG